MQKVIFILSLFILISCKTVDKNVPAYYNNQPIVDYVETLIPKDSIIYIHENRLSYARAIRTMETGTMPDPVFEKYAVNFLESEYYKKEAWEALTKRFAKDSTHGKWVTSDFKIPHRMITNTYQKEFYQNTKLHIKEVEEIIRNPKKIFVFSGVMYYDNNRYAIFSMVISGNVILSGRIKDVLIIMKKKGDTWVYVDKMLNDEFINY
ncbi:hypothetical protein KJK34_00280 [Flavobacterium sp. D11R37]|uniref:hypothetical protein n=1 Tax=Flavobacterium coralii TaxID=2838017 RepID=UPI001CA73FB9|nr:hypothetical protein [Flavobacterium coralii]MBY8961179.1 hypothetical protein [Flavobacterium coralii]